MGLEPGRWPGTSFWHGQDCRGGFAESREGLQAAAGTLNSPVSLHGGNGAKENRQKPLISLQSKKQGRGHPPGREGRGWRRGRLLLPYVKEGQRGLVWVSTPSQQGFGIIATKCLRCCLAEHRWEEVRPTSSQPGGQQAGGRQIPSSG